MAPDVLAVQEVGTPEALADLTARLDGQWHRELAEPDGRGIRVGYLLFVGDKGGEVPAVTFQRVWRDARKYALTTEARATPLARRPYDLRHAAVSTWLSGGVDPARVAEWAGHSVSVLYEVYAAYLDGGDALTRQQVQRALGHVV